jgi:hypothetical protein
LICLAYYSSATRPPDAASLEAILATARRNNAARGVTGLLCHYDGSFLQFLEGEAQDVEATFAAISRDSRHRGILEVYRGQVAERLFPDWTMAVVRADAISPEQSAFCAGLRTVELSAAAEHRQTIAPFLETFRAWVR